ncbi:MAG: hypothetical protein DLM55_04050 [Acidimicrobiales bacterium]|nr:MAG: hypothetical protein DLM55_04050 [Acidimicrobiales bacterium]
MVHAQEDVVTQVSAPAQGELLAGRYRLDSMVNGNELNGYYLWRGTDNLLSRDVSIELRIPGGEAAESMLSAAAHAGRIQHSNVAGVYDAINEGSRAFVVREWVEGRTLTEMLTSEGPLDSYRAAGLARTAAEAVAAIHSTGMRHGQLNPNTVLLNDSGELTFTHLQLSTTTPAERDIKAIGGLLYAALTGSWPLEASVTFRDLPEAVRVDGRLCTPRQIRAGIPAYLDALTMDLLDPGASQIDAATLAHELRRYDIADPELGPLSTISAEPAPQRAAWKKFGIPAAGIACILAAGLAVGAVGLPDISGSNYPLSADSASNGSGGKQELRPAAASILDPQGDGSELAGAARAIDRNPATMWQPDAYRRGDFGGIKSGMGIIVDLGKVAKVREVVVQLSAPGASLQLRGADTRAADINGYRAFGQPVRNSPAEVTFLLPRAENTRFLVVWITDMPRTASEDNPYQVGVREVRVYGA